MALGPKFNGSLEQKDSRWFRILGQTKHKTCFFSWSLYCSDCMLFLHSIFLVWILPKWSSVGQFATFCFATWTFKKDCWETSKTCNLGGFQVVRIWGQLYVKMTMTYPWRCGPMRFGYFRQLDDHVLFYGMCPVRHHCSWSQHRFKSGGSSMGFAVSKKSKKLILYCEKRRWWGIWGKLKNLCWFCNCRKLLYVKWCVTIDCVNTWITMCGGEVFCKPQEACRKKPTIGDVSVSVFFSSVNDETSRNNHRLFEFEQKDNWGCLHLQFALRYSSPTFTLNR